MQPLTNSGTCNSSNSSEREAVSNSSTSSSTSRNSSSSRRGNEKGLSNSIISSNCIGEQNSRNGNPTTSSYSIRECSNCVWSDGSLRFSSNLVDYETKISTAVTPHVVRKEEVSDNAASAAPASLHSVTASHYGATCSSTSVAQQKILRSPFSPPFSVYPADVSDVSMHREKNQPQQQHKRDSEADVLCQSHPRTTTGDGALLSRTPTVTTTRTAAPTNNAVTSFSQSGMSGSSSLMDEQNTIGTAALCKDTKADESYTQQNLSAGSLGTISVPPTQGVPPAAAALAVSATPAGTLAAAAGSATSRFFALETSNLASASGATPPPTAAAASDRAAGVTRAAVAGPPAAAAAFSYSSDAALASASGATAPPVSAGTVATSANLTTTADVACCYLAGCAPAVPATARPSTAEVASCPAGRATAAPLASNGNTSSVATANAVSTVSLPSSTGTLSLSLSPSSSAESTSDSFHSSFPSCCSTAVAAESTSCSASLFDSLPAATGTLYALNMLRMEAGLPIMGKDIQTQHTVAHASLCCLISLHKVRRRLLLSYAAVQRHIAAGSKVQRVGIVLGSPQRLAEVKCWEKNLRLQQQVLLQQQKRQQGNVRQQQETHQREWQRQQQQHQHQQQWQQNQQTGFEKLQTHLGGITTAHDGESSTAARRYLSDSEKKKKFCAASRAAGSPLEGEATASEAAEASAAHEECTAPIAGDAGITSTRNEIAAVATAIVAAAADSRPFEGSTPGKGEEDNSCSVRRRRENKWPLSVDITSECMHEMAAIAAVRPHRRRTGPEAYAKDAAAAAAAAAKAAAVAARPAHPRAIRSRQQRIRGGISEAAAAAENYFPHEGCVVYSNPHRRPIGCITSCTWSPYFGCRLAQGLVLREFAKHGQVHAETISTVH